MRLPLELLSVPHYLVVGPKITGDKINVASGSMLTLGDRVSVSSVLLELNTAGGSGRIELQGGIGDRQLPTGTLVSGSLRVGCGIVLIQNSKCPDWTCDPRCVCDVGQK